MADTAKLYVGPAGWSYEDWKGTVYPRGGGASFDPLAFIARYFDLVEVNSSFYRPPSAKTVESWARRVRNRERFRFTVKLHREFTHGQPGAVGPEDARAFSSALLPLAAEGRLGALLVQFPFWFEDTSANRDRLSRISDWFRPRCPLSIEIRHSSWVRREPLTFLNELELGFVNIDLPRAKTSPPLTAFATTETGYLRLHGRNSKAWFARDAGRDQKYDYHYADDEIDEIVKHVSTLRGKTQVVYVVANNHFRGQAPANALQIMARIANRRVPLPPPLADTYPGLREEGDPTGGDLFA